MRLLLGHETMIEYHRITACYSRSLTNNIQAAVVSSQHLSMFYHQTTKLSSIILCYALASSSVICFVNMLRSFIFAPFWLMYLVPAFNHHQWIYHKIQQAWKCCHSVCKVKNPLWYPLTCTLLMLSSQMLVFLCNVFWQPPSFGFLIPARRRQKLTSSRPEPRVLRPSGHTRNASRRCWHSILSVLVQDFLQLYPF